MAENEKMDVLVVEPGKVPYPKQIDSGLESLQKEVGGYIEATYPADGSVAAFVCDEEAKLTGKELNRALRLEDGQVYDIIAGTFLVVGLDEENFASLSEPLMKKFMEEFRVPEIFMKINGKLAIFSMEKKPSVRDKLKTSPQPTKEPKSKKPEQTR